MNGWTEKCAKCGYEVKLSSGTIGFDFSHFYKEKIKEAKEGKYGPKMQAFLKEHEYGAINVSYEQFICKECGDLSSEMDLSMFIPNKRLSETGRCGGDGKRFDYKTVDSVMAVELKYYYKKYAEYIHICEKCGGVKRVLGSAEKHMCPRCHTELIFDYKSMIIFD